ncbi:MAG: hypothetical protein ACRDZO_02050 [Egibacteraceae bacterium]
MPGAGYARVVGWVVSAAVLAACVLALRGRASAVEAGGGLPGALPFAVAVGVNALANGVVVAAWRRILGAAGAPIPPRAAAWVWSVSQLARYMLGAAQVAGRAVVGRRYGLPAWAGGVTAVVEIGWSGAITATIALAAAPWWLGDAANLGWLAAAAAVPAAILAVGLARPEVLIGAVGRVLKRLGRRDAVGVRLGRAAAARITGLYLLNSALRVGAFLVLFAAVGGSVARDGLRAAGALAVGQLIGWLAVFAPGGLGPREGATALAVAPAVGAGPALLLVAATRLAELLAEALFALVARLRRPTRQPGLP